NSEGILHLHADVLPPAPTPTEPGADPSGHDITLVMHTGVPGIAEYTDDASRERNEQEPTTDQDGPRLPTNDTRGVPGTDRSGEDPGTGSSDTTTLA
ncbi:hypothetical protein, partial [Nocardiopsis sp. LOL_012]|uniref:hypothetical protein n=1 Tax=Nocardiopsis sp. LOL_012 TaxID=3345409 RepID=UPI003A889FC7